MAPITAARIHLGLAKEVVLGTPLAPATWLQIDPNIQVEDAIKWIDDVGLRGAMAQTFQTYSGTKSSAAQFDGMVYPVSFGDLLMALMGVDVVTGAANPYSHALTLAADQPPSYTLSFFNGFNERQYPGCMIDELELKYAVDGALTFTSKWVGWPSSVGAVSVPVVDSNPAFLGWQTNFTLGGVADVRLVGMTLTAKRKAEVQHGANDSQVPVVTHVAPLDITGKLTFQIADDTELAEMLANTQPAALLTFTQSANLSLAVQMSKCAFQKVTESFSKDIVEYDYDIKAIANATDAGVGSSVSPAKFTLVNSQSAGY